jgi:hypothetical protein
MVRKPEKHEDARVFRFQVGFDGQPDKPIDAALYAFDAAGRMLGRSAVRSGEATLELSPRQMKRARLFVAPVPPGEQYDEPTLESLARRHAYEPMWRFERDHEVFELLPVPELLWPHWYWCECRVRGRVIKVETLGGVTYEKPVCHARVHVCEVDRLPWIIAELPDHLVLRLRDELLEAIRRPIPIPDPPPFAVLDPGFIDPVPVLAQAASVFGRFDEVTLNPQPLPPKVAAGRLSRLDIRAFDPQPEPPRVQLTELPFAAHSALRSASTSIVREALIRNVELIRVYWCHWDWLWPWFRYRCDELAVVETDENGRFDTIIHYPCFGDHPDLYFWVEYSVGEVWETVYRPPLPCHTYWDYVCGTEVTIRITDPRVHGCGDRPELLGKKVVIKTIGRQVSMGEIHRDSLVPAEKVKEGQVLAGWIHGGKPSPFGATLEPRVDFGSGLAGAGITHYRWLYRPLGSVSEDDWQVIDAPVSRHYREATAPGDPVVYKSVQIGPDTTVPGYYTIIDPVLPAGGEDWEVLDEGFDLASAYFLTGSLAPGKYELKLELLREVAGVMQRVDLTAEGVGLFEITDPAPLVEGSYTTTAAANDRVLIDLGTGHVVGYRLVLHVDNRECFGTINDVTVNGVPAGPCGFLEYTNLSDAAHIAFRASHPADFASFHFRVVRVATQIDEATASGLVDDAAANGFIRVGDTFGKDIDINTLMTSGLLLADTPCTRAAFAEALHVYALATNGYDRLSYLDAPRLADPAQVNLRAFAITRA